jgi:hypothetical protein
MLVYMTLAWSLLAGFGLAGLTGRMAHDRDRAPIVWAALAMAAAIGIHLGGWLMWSRIDEHDSALTAGILFLIGPVLGPGLIILLLIRLPAAPPRIPTRLAVREGGDPAQLVIEDDGLRLIRASGDRLIARPDLERIAADGECLCLTLRSTGEEVRLQVVGGDDAWRRRDRCAALARSLAGAPAPARLRRR